MSDLYQNKYNTANRNTTIVFFQLFDRELCCRQLRYSGMMETIRIRRAGKYHTYLVETILIRNLVRTSLFHIQEDFYYYNGSRLI